MSEPRIGSLSTKQLMDLRMSAERTPQGHNTILARIMRGITRLVVRFPVATLVIALALSAASMYVTVTRLTFHTSRLDLLNPESDYNRLWIEYINEFGDDDDAVIVVEGESRDRVVTVLQEVSRALSQQEHLFRAVLQ